MNTELTNRPNELLTLYAHMLLVRRSEEALIDLFADGLVPGFIHLGIGQEAVPVGVMSTLRSGDTIASTHRGHGHALGKGLALDGFFAELLGKSTGLCKGRGGSMHVADMSVGMLGANGIVGAGSAIALGSALAHQTLGRDAVAVAFFGDGALAEGLLHETLNFAALRALPLLLVCENNGWSEFSPTHRQVAFTLEKLAAAYGITYFAGDGNDVGEVAAIAHEAVAKVRRGTGPVVAEFTTTRVRGHFEGDPQKYRSPGELSSLLNCDPLEIARSRLIAGGMSEDDLGRVSEDINDRIATAIDAARRGEEADFAGAARDVYADVAHT